MMKYTVLILLAFVGYFTGFSQKKFQLEGFLPYDGNLTDIWGYEDGLGNEYALIGTETSFIIVDVTIPNQSALLFEIDTPFSPWSDVKEYNSFAYVVNEERDGLLIVDLSQLPASAPFQFVSTIDTFDLQTAHNIFIDENGVAYILGSNIGNQGAFMIDLNTTDRYQPEFLGIYDDQYVHDAYARGDTLYTSEINNGTFSMVYVANKQNPIILARQITSGTFTHNCWLHDDGSYLITTDEKPAAFIDIYDVSNFNNIQLLDKYRTSPTDSVIPHNTFFKGDYIFTSYYRKGLTLVDATLKHNLVEIGNYDTSPFSSDPGFEGNWGVYPYLPSGNILLSDREEGLFVVSPTYTRASYLSGTIMDTLTNIPLSEAKVEIMSTDYLKFSEFNGAYTIGVADSGLYDIRISHPSCQTLITSNFLLEPEIEKVLNFETNCDFSITGTSSFEIEGPQISIYTKENILNITVDSRQNLEEIHLIDLNGQLLKKIKVDAYKSQIQHQGDLAHGLYLVNFIFSQEIISKKFFR